MTLLSKTKRNLEKRFRVGFSKGYGAAVQGCFELTALQFKALHAAHTAAIRYTKNLGNLCGNENSSVFTRAIRHLPKPLQGQCNMVSVGNLVVLIDGDAVALAKYFERNPLLEGVQSQATYH